MTSVETKEYNLDNYDLEYRGVKCTAVDWTQKVFFFEYLERSFIYSQKGYVYSTADTDHICEVIHQFLNSSSAINAREYKDWSFNQIKFVDVDWEKRVFTFELNGNKHSYCDSDGSIITPEIRQLIDDFEEYAKKKALNKQIPKSPILGQDEQDYITCPACHYELEAMDADDYAIRHPHCPNCGQAIKW